MSVIFVYKIRACEITLENGIILKKTLISVLETNLLQLNILDLIWFVSEYTTVGSSNFISLGKHAFADGSWKLRGTHLLRKKIFQILVGAFLLALDNVDLNILDSVTLME